MNIEWLQKTYVKKILSFLMYVALFLLIYNVLNWYRQPRMPIAGLNQTIYQTIGHTPQQVHLLQLSQKQPILVYFWGSWCHVCAFTSPKINQLSLDYPHQVYSIAIQSGTDEEINQYMHKNHYTYPVINDDTGEIFQQWQGQVTPSYIVMYQGKVIYATTGLQPLWGLKLRLKTADLF